MRFRALARGSLWLRTTVLYGSLFALVTTAILTAAQRLLLSEVNRTVENIPLTSEVTCACGTQAPDGAPCPGSSTADPPPVRASDLQHSIAVAQQGITSTQWLLTAITIVVVIILAFMACWWLTGRLLRPLQRINGTARRVSLSILQERIALTGPQDELKDLADTFDAMLDRLEDAVASQRRFLCTCQALVGALLAV
jgi:HAMP domain-containing protein